MAALGGLELAHTLPSEGTTPQLLLALRCVSHLEEELARVVADRETLLTKESLANAQREERAADKAEISSLLRKLSAMTEQLKDVKAEVRESKTLIETQQTELDTTRAQLRGKYRELEAAKADICELQSCQAAEVARSIDANNAEWDLRWAAESAQVDAKVKELKDQHAAGIRKVREQVFKEPAEEKLLTFSITRCTAASATMSESLLKQRLNESKEKCERLQTEMKTQEQLHHAEIEAKSRLGEEQAARIADLLRRSAASELLKTTVKKRLKSVIESSSESDISDEFDWKSSGKKKSKAAGAGKGPIAPSGAAASASRSRGKSGGGRSNGGSRKESVNASKGGTVLRFRSDGPFSFV